MQTECTESLSSSASDTKDVYEYPTHIPDGWHRCGWSYGYVGLAVKLSGVDHTEHCGIMYANKIVNDMIQLWFNYDANLSLQDFLYRTLNENTTNI